MARWRGLGLRLGALSIAGALVPLVWSGFASGLVGSRSTISTVAGTGNAFYGFDGLPATSDGVDAPHGLVKDASGNIVIADSGNRAIRILALGASDTLLPGQQLMAGSLYTLEHMRYPNMLAVDESANLFVSDWEAGRIWMIAGSTSDPLVSGTLSPGATYLVAGDGIAGYAGDGGPATNAELSQPYGLAFDKSGDLFIADAANCRVREVSASTSHITTVAGTGSTGTGCGGYNGTGGAATSTELRYPTGLAFDTAGNLYVVDNLNYMVRKIDASGSITDVATGLVDPVGIAIDRAGDMFISEEDGYLPDPSSPQPSGNYVVMVPPGGSPVPMAGTGTAGYNGEGLADKTQLDNPIGLALDGQGNLYVADSGSDRVREIALSSAADSTYLMGPPRTIATLEGGVSTVFDMPHGVTEDSSGNFVIADSGDGVVKVLAVNSSDALLPGKALVQGSLYALAAQFIDPVGVATDQTGSLFVSDWKANKVIMVAAAPSDPLVPGTLVPGTPYLVAGDGVAGLSGDGGPATSAELQGPFGVAIDHTGSLYLADSWNCRVREVNKSGVIETVAGLGNGNIAKTENSGCGYNGVSVATQSELWFPSGIAFDASGMNLYIADTHNWAVRELNTSTGTISEAMSGVILPTDVALDSSGNLFVAESNVTDAQGKTQGNEILESGFSLGPAAGPGLSELNGSSTAGYSGDGGPAENAQLYNPEGIALDSSGDLLIVDSGNDRLRIVYSQSPTAPSINPPSPSVPNPGMSPSSAGALPSVPSPSTSPGTIAGPSAPATTSLPSTIGVPSLMAPSPSVSAP